MHLSIHILTLLVVLLAPSMSLARKQPSAGGMCAMSVPVSSFRGPIVAIPNAATAIAIARAIAIATYGAEAVKIREPLVATPGDTTWGVVGKLPEPLLEGDLVVRMCNADGKVFHMELGG